MTNISPEITLKELFERMVALEVKLEEMKSRNAQTRRQFTNIAILILALEILNLIVHVFVH